MYTALIINQGRLYPVFSNSNESLEEFHKRLQNIPILEIQEWEELYKDKYGHKYLEEY